MVFVEESDAVRFFEVAPDVGGQDPFQKVIAQSEGLPPIAQAASDRVVICVRGLIGGGLREVPASHFRCLACADAEVGWVGRPCLAHVASESCDVDANRGVILGIIGVCCRLAARRLPCQFDAEVSPVVNQSATVSGSGSGVAGGPIKLSRRVRGMPM